MATKWKRKKKIRNRSATDPSEKPGGDGKPDAGDEQGKK